MNICLRVSDCFVTYCIMFCSEIVYKLNIIPQNWLHKPEPKEHLPKFQCSVPKELLSKDNMNILEYYERFERIYKNHYRKLPKLKKQHFTKKNLTNGSLGESFMINNEDVGLRIYDEKLKKY